MFNVIQLQQVNPTFWRIQFTLSKISRVQVYVQLGSGAWQMVQDREFFRSGFPTPTNWYNNQSTHKALTKGSLDCIEVRATWEVMIVMKEIGDNVNDPFLRILDFRQYTITF